MSAGLIFHDSDEVGVPGGADVAWRQRTLEGWVQRALRYQRDGHDMLLTGQSPLAELIAAPSTPLLDGFAVAYLMSTTVTGVEDLRSVILVGGQLMPNVRSSLGQRGIARTPTTPTLLSSRSSRVDGR